MDAVRDGDGHDALITRDVMWDATAPGAPVELSRGYDGTSQAFDLDGDGADEYFASQMHGWGATFSNGWSLGEAMNVLDVFDLDGDGVLEVVVGETIVVDHHLRVRQRVPVPLSSIRVFDGRGWGLHDGEVWEVPLP